MKKLFLLVLFLKINLAFAQFGDFSKCNTDNDCVNASEADSSCFVVDPSSTKICPAINKNNLEKVKVTLCPKHLVCREANRVSCVKKLCLPVDLTPNIIGVRKPAIYLYPESHEQVEKKPAIFLNPEKETEIKVELDSSVKIDFVYPDFSTGLKGWIVKADQNGIITTSDGRKLSYLFWEGRLPIKPMFLRNVGFVIEAGDIKRKLELYLDELGLNQKERSEFIIYWGPILSKNKYTYVNFITDEYQKIAPLKIEPKPDSVFQLYMVYQPLEQLQKIEPQTLKKFERKGFSVVEWGGGELKDAK